MAKNARPRFAPPGKIFLPEAIDCVGPELVPDWNGDEKDAPKRAKELMAPFNAKQISVPKSEKLGRRPRFRLPEPLIKALARRREAFGRLRELCAYGTVPSHVLNADFTVGSHIPPRNWVDDRFADQMFSSKRTTVAGPLSTAGWVLIDVAALQRALLQHGKIQGNLEHGVARPSSAWQQFSDLTVGTLSEKAHPIEPSRTQDGKSTLLQSTGLPGRPPKSWDGTRMPAPLRCR